MHNHILQTAIREGHVCSYLFKCCHPSSCPRGVYLYGIHLVFVFTDVIDEVLLPQAMTLQSLFQLFLHSNMQITSVQRQKQ